MKRIFTIVVALCVALPMLAAEPATFTANQPMANPQSVVDEEDDNDKWEFWWEAGFDLASNYMWRGYDQSYTGNMFDPSFQPSLTLGYGKFYINLWGNASLLSDYKEFDMFLGFDHENLSVTIYDVFCGVGADFGAQSFFDKEAHNLTATIDYTFFDRLRLHQHSSTLRTVCLMVSVPSRHTSRWATHSLLARLWIWRLSQVQHPGQDHSGWQDLV